MNVNIKFHGVVEQILEEAIRRGYASTKTDALRLGVFELNNKYNLLDKIEDDADVAHADAIMEKARRGKSRLHPEKEIFEKLK